MLKRMIEVFAKAPALLAMAILWPSLSMASGPSFNDTDTKPLSASSPAVLGNVGIGTTLTTKAGLAVMNGNVGIGTWVPAYDLDVPGAVYGINAKIFRVNGLQSFQLLGSPARIGVGGDVSLHGESFYSSGNEVMRIDTNGNMGIGTTTPVGGLAVMNGNVGIGTWVPAGALDVEGTLSTAIFKGNVGIGTSAPGSSGLYVGGINSTSGDVVFAGVGGTGQIRFLCFNGSSGCQIEGNGFLSLGGGDSPQLSLQSNNIASFSDNVGIGTNLTANRLDIQGAVGIGTAYAGYYSAPANGMVVQGNVGIGTWVPANALDVVGNINATGTISGTFSPSSLTVTGNTVLNSTSGTVGIGTAAPTSKFQIKASAGAPFAIGLGSAYDGGNMFDPGYIGFNAVHSQTDSTWIDSSDNAHNGGGAIAADIFGRMYFYTMPSTGASQQSFTNSQMSANISMSIDSNRNVGIGSTLSSASLEIVKNSTYPLFMLSSTGAAANNGDYMIVDSVGNVGIGTATPQARLTVLGGNVGIGTWTPATILGITSAKQFDGITLYNQSNYVAKFIGSNASNDNGTIQLLNGGTTNVNLVASGNSYINGGNVGIGSSSPTALLNVYSSSTAATATIKSIGGGALFNIDRWTTGNYAGINLYTLGTQKWFAGMNAANSSNDFQISTGLGVFPFLAINQTSGNVGIGTDAAPSKLSIAGGGVGIGTVAYSSYVTTAAPNGGMLVEGNVGIGTWVPANALDVVGNINATGTISGTFSPTSLTVTGNSDLATTSGNVGIGTTTPQGGAGLVVTNGNVGIGTWVPTGTLQLGRLLSPAATYGGYIVVENQGDNFGVSAKQGIEFASNSSGAGYGWRLSNPQGIGNNVLDNAFVFESRNNSSTWTTRMVMTGANVGLGTTKPAGGLAIMNGNVGIGTWVPASALDVVGNINATGTISGTFSPSSLTVTGNAYLATASGNVGIGTTTPQGGLVVINGNVGIGTWAPAASLEVLPSGVTASFKVLSSGSSNQSLINGGSYLRVSSNVIPHTGATYDLGAFPGNYWRSFYVGNILASSNIGIGTVTAASALGVVGGVGIGTGINSSFVTTAAPSGGMLVEGNVGIGTLIPESALSVNGFISANGSDSITSASTAVGQNNGWKIGLWGNSNAIGVEGHTVALRIGASTNNWFSIFAQNLPQSNATTSVPDTAAVVSFGGNGSGLFSGNVGIGTTTPQGGLVVTNGNVGIGTWVPSAQLALAGTSNGKFNLFNSSFDMSFDGGADGAFAIANTSSGGRTWFRDNASNTILSLNNSGDNVGIGTTTPQAGAGLVVMSGTVGIGTWSPASTMSVVGGETIGTSAGYLDSANGAASKVLLVEGNVGIGTWAVSNVRLNVVGGNVRVATSGVGAFNISNSGGSSFLATDPGTALAVGMNPSFALRFSTDGNIGINTTGTVGIGTVDSTNMLGIVGEVGIGTITASDFVTTPAPTGGMIIEGNVGIGTSIPKSLLHLRSGAGVSTSGQNVLRISGLQSGSTLGSGPRVVFDNSGAHDFADIRGYAFGVSLGGLEFGTGYDAVSPRMVIDNSGNVGIGTTTPIGALSVMNGNVGIGTWVPNGTFSVQRAASHAGQATCWTTNGAIGYCTTSVNASGACTCSAL